MNSRTSPSHAHQPEPWHQCWDEYNRLNAEIHDLTIEKSESPVLSARDYFVRQIKARREQQRRLIAKAQTFFIPAPQQLAA